MYICLSFCQAFSQSIMLFFSWFTLPNPFSSLFYLFPSNLIPSHSHSFFPNNFLFSSLFLLIHIYSVSHPFSFFYNFFPFLLTLFFTNSSPFFFKSNSLSFQSLSNSIPFPSHHFLFPSQFIPIPLIYQYPFKSLSL